MLDQLFTELRRLTDIAQCLFNSYSPLELGPLGVTACGFV